MAGIFERMTMIVKANVNDLLSNFEDPEKMVDQAILDATEEYGKIKQASLDTLANENRTKKELDRLNAEVSKWHNIAISALKSGNEEDARKALAQENDYKSRAVTQQTVYESAKAAADKLRQKLHDMEDEINEMKAKANQIKAVSATAKATNAANRISQKGTGRGGFDAFARVEEKANQELARAEAMESLDAGTDQETDDLEKKYAGGGQASIEDSLAALKAELGM